MKNKQEVNKEVNKQEVSNQQVNKQELNQSNNINITKLINYKSKNMF